jgi:hypothetical protein
MMFAAVFAALALSAVAASTAAASETLSFIAQSGKFPVKTTVKGGNVTLRVGSEGYTCISSAGEGEITGHKTGKMKFRFKECGRSGVKCQSGEVTGEIVTETVPVELVYISKEHHEAGLDFNYEEPTEPFPPPAHQFASWSCGGFGKFGIRRSIIAAVTPVNTSTLSHTVKFSENATLHGIQNPTAYETEAGKRFEAFPEMDLETEGYFEGSLASQLEMTTTVGQGQVEIKA